MTNPDIIHIKWALIFVVIEFLLLTVYYVYLAKENKKKRKKMEQAILKKDLDMKNTIQSINSWLGHASHCNSHKLQNAVLNKCNFLFNTDYFSKVELELINLIESDINHNL